MAKLSRIVKTKPKTIKIGHGYYDLKLIREIFGSLPEGQVTITSHPCYLHPAPYYRNPNTAPLVTKVPSIDVQYPRGHFHLEAVNLPYYEADKGKVKQVRHLTYRQGEKQPANTFSLLAVELKLR